MVKDKLFNVSLNINLVLSKFEQVKHIIQNKVDVLVLTETKMDSSFSDQQIYIEGFCLPFRLDRNIHGGGILIYVREDIPSKALNKHVLREDVEAVFTELNLREQKRILRATCHSFSQKDGYCFYHMGKAIDTYHQIYDKFLLTRDFNAEDIEPCLSQFLFEYDAIKLVNEKTCFKSKTNPSCVDLLITKFF